MCGAEFLKQASPNAYNNDHSNYKHNECTSAPKRSKLLIKGRLGLFLFLVSDVTAFLSIVNR